MRKYTKTAGLAIAFTFIASACSLSPTKPRSAQESKQNAEVLLVAGSYNPAEQEGIRLYSFNEERDDSSS